VATPVDERVRAKTPARYSPDEILRFEACERQLHWSIAVPFTICYLTALVLVAVYNPAPTRPLRMVFAWIHRVSGIGLTLLPPLVLFIHRREFRRHLGNIREAWTWGLDELKWLLLMGPAMLSRRVTLPHQGKFNAAEKINFIMVMSTYPLYIATGLTIWLLRPAYVSWMIHLALALAATPLVLGHVFMATVNPDTRVGLSGMFSGWVNREWARHHYRRWYDEQFGPLGHAVHAAPAVGIAAAPEPATATTVRQILPLRPDIAPAVPALSRPAVSAQAALSRRAVPSQTAQECA
jgi:formate dehydrogenase subunit gamma